ncbi:hypothetical protein AVEN_186655-1 [Araneus ventricosus]|uniref:Uncharacterized protein n=1 Tax=Araneus ventricosus TaxID=182803 RepID=A0A4Y2KL37_ARAVE|nr:hypothetical protein AVEN_186655-1 [Araneus ventricosus]
MAFWYYLNRNERNSPITVNAARCTGLDETLALSFRGVTPRRSCRAHAFIERGNGRTGRMSAAWNEEDPRGLLLTDSKTTASVTCAKRHPPVFMNYHVVKHFVILEFPKQRIATFT